METETETE